MKFLLSILYSILVIVFLFSGSVVVYAVYECVASPECISFDKTQGLLPPFVLTLGVSVALITLQLNRKDKQEDISEKNSEFFFNHCVSRIDEALSYIKPRSPKYDEGLYNPSGIGPANYHLEQAMIVLSDVLLMEDNIKIDIHKSAYESKKKNFINSTLRILKGLSFSSCTGINWAGECLEEKIENYNSWISSEKAKITSQEDYEEFVRDKRAFDKSTPFSNGLSISALSSILCFCLKDKLRCHKGTEVIVLNIDVLADSDLNMLFEYFQACINYKNNEGVLEKAS